MSGTLLFNKRGQKDTQTSASRFSLYSQTYTRERLHTTENEVTAASSKYYLGGPPDDFSGLTFRKESPILFSIIIMYSYKFIIIIYLYNIISNTKKNHESRIRRKNFQNNIRLYINEEEIGRRRREKFSTKRVGRFRR